MKETPAMRFLNTIIQILGITTIYLSNSGSYLNPRKSFAVEANIYKGGSIYWKPLEPTTPNKKTIEITYRLTWSKSEAAKSNNNQNNKRFCEYSPFLTGEGQTGYFHDFLICNAGCNGLRTIFHNECKEENELDDWITAQGSFNYTLSTKAAPYLDIGFKGCCWENDNENKVRQKDVPWSLMVNGSLNVREDTGKLNNPPIPVNSPLIKLERGCLHRFKLNNYDDDGDEVRCRLVKITDSQCTNTNNSCTHTPKILLDEFTCEMRVVALGDKNILGTYNIEIVMEDYVPSALNIRSLVHQQRSRRNKPLSTVSMQMIIQLYDPIKKSCSENGYDASGFLDFSSAPSIAALSDFEPVLRPISGFQNNEFDWASSVGSRHQNRANKIRRAGVFVSVPDPSDPRNGIITNNNAFQGQAFQPQIIGPPAPPTVIAAPSQPAFPFAPFSGSSVPQTVAAPIVFPAPAPTNNVVISPSITPASTNSECIEVPLSLTFQGTIYVRSPTPDYTVQNVFTVSPTGLQTSPVYKVSDNPPLFGQNVTWLPSSTQTGPNSFCFFAVNTVGQRSATSCLTLYVTAQTQGTVNACTKRPQVKCTSGGLEVSLLVDDPKFNNGIFYVKNNFKQPGCQLMIPPTGKSEARLRIPLGACGLQINPQTMRYETIVVLQPHSMLVTNMARAYHVVCQPSLNMVEIPVRNKADVNMITTENTLRQTHMPPMPIMLFTDENGQPLTRASLGQNVRVGLFLPNQENYEMRIRSCVARARETTWQFELIDARGCPTDPEIFPQFQMMSKGTAISTFPAFKFPDSEFIQMECVVTVCWQQCPARLNPICGAGGISGGRQIIVKSPFVQPIGTNNGAASLPVQQSLPDGVISPTFFVPKSLNSNPSAVFGPPASFNNGSSVVFFPNPNPNGFIAQNGVNTGSVQFSVQPPAGPGDNFVIDEAGRQRRKTRTGTPNPLFASNGDSNVVLNRERRRTVQPFFKFIGIRNPDSQQSYSLARKTNGATPDSPLSQTKKDIQAPYKDFYDAQDVMIDDTNNFYKFSNEDLSDDKLSDSLRNDKNIVLTPNPSQQTFVTSSRVISKRTLDPKNQINIQEQTQASVKSNIKGMGTDTKDELDLTISSKYLQIFDDSKNDNKRENKENDENTDQKIVVEKDTIERLRYSADGNDDIEDITGEKISVFTHNQNLGLKSNRLLDSTGSTPKDICLGFDKSPGNRAHSTVSRPKTFAFLLTGVMAFSSIIVTLITFLYCVKQNRDAFQLMTYGGNNNIPRPTTSSSVVSSTPTASILS